MRKKKKKLFKDKYARRRFILLIIIILIIFFAIKAIMGNFSKGNSNKLITLLLNNELINLKNEIFIDEKQVIYLSKDDVENIFDKTIYYNNAEKELITTYNKHIGVLKINDTYMIVNDSNMELKGTLIEKNKKVYLPISEMEIIYDLEIEYAENTKTVIADELSREKKKALILKKVNLKEKANIFSKNIEKLEQGEYVVIVSEEGRYFKVRTTDGNIGYVKSKKVSDPKIIREDWVEPKTNVNILKTASDISKDYYNVKIDKEKNNVVIPEFFYIDTNNIILDKTNSGTEEYTKYMNWVKDNNIKIWATLSNNVEVSKSLRTYNDRNKIINALYYLLVNYQFTGINLDFKKIDDVNSFNRFVIELTPRLKELGINVSVTNNSNVNKNKLENIVDIIIE